MRLGLTKQFFGALVVLVSAASASNAFAADGSFIVASQVVSDSAMPASAYVGDLASATIGDSCASGNCGGSGDCQNGSCALGSGGSGGLLGNLCNKNDGGIGCQPRKYDQPDLFYNFYSQGNCNTANAQMYVSPMPVPQFVGHTYGTYQPLYPHEFMYWHKNTYHNNYDNGRGVNRTKVKYYAPPVKTAISNIYWNKLRLPR